MAETSGGGGNPPVEVITFPGGKLNVWENKGEGERTFNTYQLVRKFNAPDGEELTQEISFKGSEALAAAHALIKAFETHAMTSYPRDDHGAKSEPS